MINPSMQQNYQHYKGNQRNQQQQHSQMHYGSQQQQRDMHAPILAQPPASYSQNPRIKEESGIQQHQQPGQHSRP